MGHRSAQQYTTLSLKFISSSECIAWLTVYGIEAVAIIVLNALTAIIYLKVHSLRKRSMYLVISLAVADMFVGGLLIFDGWFLGRDCNFWTSDLNRPSNFVVIALCRLVPLASLTNLAAISLERTHATFRPFAHHVAKKKIYGAAVVVVWMTAGLSSTISGINISLPPLLKRSHFFYVSYLTFYSLCLLVIFVSYTSIAINIIRGNQSHHRGASNRETKLTVTLFIVTVASLLLTLPYIIFEILFSLSHTMPNNSTTFLLSSFSVLLFSANSLVNPVLYTFRIPKFRRALLSILRFRRQPEPAQGFPLKDL
ncbi:adenosine receptor A3-like [Acropora muricata]|uniref:adenosine receptor A3-like n=1 Tax=Acropora muricata TaxID=159855 RepID=UPI0034E589F5